MTLVGYILGSDGMQPRWRWDPNAYGRCAGFVPQSALLPIEADGSIPLSQTTPDGP